MDDPLGINPAGDSTYALALEAQARGHALWVYHPSGLSSHQGRLTAMLRCSKWHDDAKEWVTLEPPKPGDLSEMDAVLMRQDPPFDMTYLSATYLLEQLDSGTPVFNNPAYVRNHPEKLAILDYPDAIPPTLISSQEEAIRAFCQTHERIVIKPLYGFGGRSVYVMDRDDGNIQTLLEHHREQSGEPLMIQPYLPEVKEKDIRVLLIGGRISAAIGRIPQAGSIRANMRVGGKPVACELNATQRQLCEHIAADLDAAGVLFAGLDLIGDYLTEINITSPTGIRAAADLYQHNPASDFWDALEHRLTAD